MNAVGYTLDQIRGQHHRIFLYPEDATSPDYAKFWETLGQGEFVSGVFKRRRKDGKTIWIMGSYNPIFDKNGKVYKLVKYVNDVTKEKEQEFELKQTMEQLQLQEEELRQNLEEMETINEEMAAKNKTIAELHEELKRNYQILEAAKDNIEQRMKATESDIQDSIRYAQRIQRAIIPDAERVAAMLPENFKASIYFKPRDVVSGDFYWVGQWKRRTVIAVGDGTGHGVPGSFMSIIGITAIAKLVERGVIEPSIMLEELDEEIQRTLWQSDTNVQDTLEMVIAVVDPEDHAVTLSSAMRPVYHWTNGNLIEIAPNKNPVGGTQYDKKSFVTQRIVLEPGDTMYFMSDGFSDQLGGPVTPPRRWGRSAMKEALVNMSNYPIEKRPAIIQKLHSDWRGFFQEQTDDIVVFNLEYNTAQNKPVNHTSGNAVKSDVLP